MNISLRLAKYLKYLKSSSVFKWLLFLIDKRQDERFFMVLFVIFIQIDWLRDRFWHIFKQYLSKTIVRCYLSNQNLRGKMKERGKSKKDKQVLI